MELTKITENVFQLTLAIVNVFLIDHPAGLILIDAGPKGSSDLIFDGIRQIGKQPENLMYIIITHAHYDHSGGLASILKMVNAQVYTSPLCAQMLSEGIAFKPSSKILFFLLKLVTAFGLIRPKFLYIEPINSTIKTVTENAFIPDQSGLQVITAPGHAREQIALFYPIKEALLFAADVVENLNGMKAGFCYQSTKINVITLKKLKKIPFKSILFGHGVKSDYNSFNSAFESWKYGTKS